MTDRISHLTVMLETNMREDDAAGLIAAIGQFKGVLRVVSGPPADNMSEAVAESRLRHELFPKIFDVIMGAKK